MSPGSVALNLEISAWCQHTGSSTPSDVKRMTMPAFLFQALKIIA